MTSIVLSCSSCGSTTRADARYCTACGKPIQAPKCSSCGCSLPAGANFCSSCGTLVGQAQAVPNTGAVGHLISAIQLLINDSHPGRVLDSSLACLREQPLPSYAALASVLSMSCYARLDKVPEAEAAALQTRKFYAAHLKLSDNQQARFIQGGHLIDDLQPIGNKDLEQNPWLYLILGHAKGPLFANAFRGTTEQERRKIAVGTWRTFFDDLTPLRRVLAYLMFVSSRLGDATQLFPSLGLISREYEAMSPVRIEWVWPRVMLGECNSANNQPQKAIHAWHSARSLDICHALAPDNDDWGNFALPWVEKAKSRLTENRITIPLMEVSLKASKHLGQSIGYLLGAEQYEETKGDLEQNVASIQRAGPRYANLLNSSAAELQLVEHLDTFTWAKIRFDDSSVWYRYDSVRGYLFHKFALLQLANDNLPLAIANLKQAVEAWPMLSWLAVLGGLQMACGLDSEARNTYRICLERTYELTAFEPSDEACEEIVREVRQALYQQ